MTDKPIYNEEQYNGIARNSNQIKIRKKLNGITEYVSQKIFGEQIDSTLVQNRFKRELGRHYCEDGIAFEQWREKVMIAAVEYIDHKNELSHDKRDREYNEPRFEKDVNAVLKKFHLYDEEEYNLLKIDFRKLKKSALEIAYHNRPVDKGNSR